MPAVRLDATAVHATVTEDQIIVMLADGRKIAAPLAWSPRPSPTQRPSNARTGA